MELTPRVPPAAPDRRPVVVWFARSVTVGLLVAAALWWSSTPNRPGISYCEAHHESFCDGFGVEKLAPAILWTLTVVGTLTVAIISTVTRPASTPGRVVWSAMVSVATFIANRNNIWWAVAVSVATVAVMMQPRDPVDATVTTPPAS